MFTHPTITAALADERRRDRTARADASRLARAARNRRPTTRPGRSPQPREAIAFFAGRGHDRIAAACRGLLLLAARRAPSVPLE
jgi:hypothetical protein